MVINNSTRNHMEFLVPFDMIIDTDLGLLMLIRFQYPNEDYFNLRFFYLLEEDYTYLLTQRATKNPLRLINNGSLTEEDLDSLYNEFLTTKYDEILLLSKPTDVLSMITMMNVYNDKAINYTILCRNEKEVKCLKRFNIPSRVSVILSTDEDFDIRKYDYIYFNDIYDILEYSEEELAGKTVCIANCIYNKESITDQKGNNIFIFKGPVLMKLVDVCKITSINLYSIQAVKDAEFEEMKRESEQDE